MSAPTWVTEGTDLEFVKRGACPGSVSSLLDAGEAWINLFGNWYEREQKASPDEMATWSKIVGTHSGTTDLDGAQREMNLTAEDMRRWDLLIGIEFDGACGMLREWLTDHDGTRRDEPEGDPQTVRDPGETGAVEGQGQGLGQSQGLGLALGTRRPRANRRRLATAEDPSNRGERVVVVAPGFRSDLSEPTPARMEAITTAFAHEVDPLLKELYERHQTRRVVDLPGVRRLEEAHSLLLTLEAELREACHRLMQPLPQRRQRRDAQQQVLASWVSYTQACTRLAAAMVEAAEALVALAADGGAQKPGAGSDAPTPQTQTQTQAEPESEPDPEAVELTVAALTALLQCLSLATGPAAIAAIATVSTSVGAAERLTDRIAPPHPGAEKGTAEGSAEGSGEGDHTGGHEAVLHAWARAKDGTFPALSAQEFIFAGRRVPEFTLQARRGGEPATAAGAATAVSACEGTDGQGSRYRGFASALDLPRTRGVDCWTVEFLVTADGEARLDEQSVTFRWLLRHPQSDPESSIIASTEGGVELLNEILDKDGALDFLPRTRAIFGLPEQHFFLDGTHGLLDRRGSCVLAKDDIPAVLQALPDALEVIALFASGRGAEVALQALPSAVQDLVWDWGRPRTAYTEVRDAEGDIPCWLAFNGHLASLADDETAHQRFNEFIATDEALRERLGQLRRWQAMAEAGTPGNPDDQNELHMLESFKKLIETGQSR